MKILFLHQNFPGQFRHLASALAADSGNHVLALTKSTAPGLNGIGRIHYTLGRSASAQTHHYVRPLESGVLHGQAVIRALLPLRRHGYIPDVVIAHPGWGEALYVKDVFPHTKLISFFEFFYHADGADCGFDPEYPINLDDRARIRSKNALNLLNLEACDVGVSPTQWQKQLHPSAYHSKIEIIHEGVDCDNLRPDPEARFSLPNGQMLSRKDEVVTYVARNLEPHRGFPSFMRAVAQICQRRPHAQIAVVGGDQVSYGRPPKDALNWREKMQQEVCVNPNQVHFLGKIPYPSYRKLLQISRAHVYLTYPFVLSWSMLEAMASGCLVIGSATPPVQEVIRHGENGLLVDFFSPDNIANAVDQALSEQQSFSTLRQQARETVLDRYSTAQGVGKYSALIQRIV